MASHEPWFFTPFPSSLPLGIFYFVSNPRKARVTLSALQAGSDRNPPQTSLNREGCTSTPVMGTPEWLWPGLSAVGCPCRQGILRASLSFQSGLPLSSGREMLTPPGPVFNMSLLREDPDWLAVFGSRAHPWGWGMVPGRCHTTTGGGVAFPSEGVCKQCTPTILLHVELDPGVRWCLDSSSFLFFPKYVPY